jgi:hypothetical protein
VLEEFEVRDALGGVLTKKESQIENVFGQGSLGWTPPAIEELFAPVAGY